MKRKLILVSVLVTTMLMLSGCCLSHEWQEATCTTPKTCANCGEVEGEALEHSWIDATCSEAKHCSVCGEKEGEPLEHSLTEANYQQSAECTVCGEKVGEPLQPDFEKYGLVVNAELDTPISFLTQCSMNDEYMTEGVITFSDYKVLESDDPLGEEGYEWRAVVSTVVFPDKNAYDYGYSLNLLDSDYYDIVGTDNTYNSETETYTVNYKGVDYTECMTQVDRISREWTDEGCVIVYYHTIRVPIGYDGVVIGYFDRESATVAESLDEWYIYDTANENTVFFRMK